MDFRQHALAGVPLAEHLIIDAHGHLGPYGQFHIPAATPPAVIEIMDRIGIRSLAASHLLSLVGDPRRGHDQLAEAMGAYPGRFIGYAGVNPNYPGYEAELERCLGELGMSGIKVHTDFQHCPIDAPGFWRAYEIAAEHGGLPVLGHGLTNAPALERIARAFPGVPFLAAHSGGGYQGRYPDPVARLAAELGNVYLDLTSSTGYFGGLEALVRDVGAAKILYGSDLCFMQATHQIGRVLMAEVEEDDKAAILGGNAARLFGLVIARPGGSQ